MGFERVNDAERARLAEIARALNEAVAWSRSPDRAGLEYAAELVEDAALGVTGGVDRKVITTWLSVARDQLRRVIDRQDKPGEANP